MHESEASVEIYQVQVEERTWRGAPIFFSSIPVVFFSHVEYEGSLSALYLKISKIAFVQVVIFRDGTYLTLKEVFESLDLTG